jgi:hypothetical protein
VIPNVLEVDYMGPVNFQAALDANQLERIHDRKAAKVEHHMVVRAKAKNVVLRVRPIVGSPQWLNVSCLCIWSPWAFKAEQANLAPMLI